MDASQMDVWTVDVKKPVEIAEEALKEVDKAMRVGRWHEAAMRAAALHVSLKSIAENYAPGR